jgi:hypothetical protein
MRCVLLSLAVLVIGASCGQEAATPRSGVGSGDCLEAWNAGGNEANRDRVSETDFQVGSVSRWHQIADFGSEQPAPPPAEHESEGCRYLFHDDHRFISFSGRWEGDALVWGVPQMLQGSWSPEQQQSQRDEVGLVVDGQIERRLPAAPPASDPPTSALEPPPPSWIETRVGSQWLGYSTFCWRSGCADYIRPSCTDASHVPDVKAERGELIRFHLGFEPKEVVVTLFDDDAARPPEQHRLAVDQQPVWRVEREGAFAIFAVAEAGGDASYVGCLRLAR